MSFATKVAALRRFLGVPENLEMLGMHRFLAPSAQKAR
jgi:hypothetical protein